MSHEFHAVLDAALLPPGASKAVQIDGHNILVGNAAGEFFAVQNRCTHQDSPLEGGRIRNGLIACPLHGVMFDVRTGCGRGQMGRVPLRTFALRVKELRKDPGIKYVMIFKNHGRNAGASLLHPHSQIVAMPMVPLRVTQEIDGASQYFKERGNCVFCDIVREELAFKKRIVAENASFLAVTPYASRFSFEIWILPKAHLSHFETLTDSGAGELAEVVKTTIGKLYASLSGLSYNLIVHTMPVQEPETRRYHWHIEIMPKLTHVAGFEWGTGFYINTVPPEDAAKLLNTGGKYKV